jgi:AraC-like DNA-binding protein
MTRQFKRAYGLTPARWTALTAPSQPGEARRDPRRQRSARVRAPG